MKRLFYPIYLLSIVFLGAGCSSSNIDRAVEHCSGFNLTGQWAISGNSSWQSEIMFDFRPADNGLFELKVWGQAVVLDSVQLEKNQFLFSYKSVQGGPFHVLGTVLTNDEIKLSRVQYSIDGFQPVGKLGEKVYRLQRLTEGEPYMLTQTSSAKRSSIRNYED